MNGEVADVEMESLERLKTIVLAKLTMGVSIKSGRSQTREKLKILYVFFRFYE